MTADPRVWHGYNVNPMDFGWDLLRTVADHRVFLQQVDPEDPDDTPPLVRQMRFSNVIASVEKFARDHLEWEGDVRGEQYVFVLPNSYEVEIGFAWKQDNNGQTFIISPKPLDYINESEISVQYAGVLEKA